VRVQLLIYMAQKTSAFGQVNYPVSCQLIALSINYQVVNSLIIMANFYNFGLEVSFNILQCNCNAYTITQLCIRYEESRAMLICYGC
jgi:hypothetical protein